MATTNDYDFGFSFSDDASSVNPQTAPTEELKQLGAKVDSLLSSQNQLLEEKYKAKLREVESLILPLLYNLMKNPDKPIINWPNRETVIKSQIEKIIAITRS
jgi:hypothetical protein